MNTAEIINSIKEHVAAAYTAVTGKDGTIPEQKNLSNLAAAIESIQIGSSAENPYKARTYSEMNGYRTKDYANVYVEYTGQRQFTRDQIRDSNMYDKLYFDFPRQIGWVETFDWDNPDSNWTSDGLLYKCIVLFNVTPTKISDNTTEEAIPFSVYQMTTTGDSSDAQAGTVMYGIGFPSSFSWVSWGGTPDKEYSRTGYKLKITNVKREYYYLIGDIISTTGKWSQIMDGTQFGYKHGTYKIGTNSNTVDNFQKLDLVLEDGGGGTARKTITNDYSYNLNSYYDYILKYSYEGKSSSVICKVGNFKFEGTQVTGANQLYNVTSDGYPDGIFFSLDPSCPLPYGWNAASIVDNFDLSNPKQSTPNKSVVGVSSNLYTLVGKTVTIEDISTAADMIYYTTLPSLSTPAVATDIVKGKQAIDAEGNRINGTFEPIVLPTLTNEGTAADLAKGKQLIGSSGEIVTGTATIVPTPEPETGYFVKVIDYDGTELLSARGENGDSFTLPPAPSHNGLVFQGWSASYPIMNETVTIDNNNIMVGAVYTTASGLNEFDIELTEDFGLSVSLKIDGEKDWGDGTTDSETTHTYATYGNYTIKCGGTTLNNCFYLMPCTFARLATVTKIGNSAFDGCSDLMSITIPNNVVSIGERVFSGCSSLISVTIPDSVANIGEYSFSDCNSLISITIPDSMTTIGSYAFSGCGNLTSITIPNGVRDINYSAFFGCNGLTNIIIPSSVTIISSSIFQNCSNLTSITIPDSVTGIGSSAFSGCSNLTSIRIPNGITNIEGGTFSGCRSLTSITIPDTVISIDYSAFSRCSSLTSVTIPDGVTIIKNNTFDGCSNLTSVTIPNGVTTIESSAFENCRSLTNITIPNTVTNIGYSAFEGCSSLTSIIIPDSVTSIGNDAFNKCNGLTSIIIGNGVTSFGFYFANYSNLISVVIGNSITTINRYAFSGCSRLTNITIPDSVTSIGEGAFSDCTSLTNITIPNSVTTIDKFVFQNCSGLTSITIPDNVTTISNSAFFGCSSLTSVTIPNSVTSIGEGAFQNCSGLTSITIGNGVTSIDRYTFKDCTNLTNITIPNSITEIFKDTFNGCSKIKNIYITDIAAWFNISGLYDLMGCSKNKNLYINNELVTSIVIPDNITAIGSSAFENCSSLTSITIPDSVTTINGSAFEGCNGLTNVTIGNGVTSIGWGAFNDCNVLTNVYISDIAKWCAINFRASSANPLTYAHNLYVNGVLVRDLIIPNSTTSISEYAFYNYTGLMSITIPDSVTNIGNYAFDGCTGLTSITIPNGVTRISYGAFNKCSNLTSVIIPSSVTSISDYAFDRCYKLIEVYNKSSLRIVAGSDSNGNVAYYAKNVYTNEGGSKLTTDENGYVIYTDGDEKILVTYTGTETELVLPADITQIYKYAFYNCKDLTSIRIGSNVINIGDYAFSGCSGLTNIIVEEGNTKYYSIGNCLIETATKTLVAGCKTSVIPTDGSVTNIGKSAFNERNNLTNIIIPDSVTNIGEEAFENCNDLTSITIPDSVTNIGKWAFSGCSNLTNITISNNVTNILDYTFNGCIGLTSVIIGNGVTSIGTSAFENCSSLTNIIIPNSVASIGTDAFRNCSSLASVIIGNNVTSIGWSAFENCSSLTSITIPDSVTDIKQGAFNGCSSLVSIIVGNGVTSIGNDAFGDCSGLTSVYISDIAKWCAISFKNSFANPLTCAHNLYVNSILVKDLVIPNGVTSIGSYTFKNCNRLANITIPDSVINIGEDAFSGCRRLISITIGNGVMNIGNNAFDGTAWYNNQPSGLVYAGKIAYTYKGTMPSNTLITIKEGTVGIAGFAFRSCGNLTSIIIPSSMTSIGDQAFEYCDGLKTVFYAGTEEQWGAISIGSSNGCLTSATIIYNYDGIERTYSFVTNCDQNINPITAKYLISLPTLVRDGYHLYGWYDNETFEGKAVSVPYCSKDKTTLYARWLTPEEFDVLSRDGTSFEKAYIAKSGQTYDVNITRGGQMVYFTFTPTTNGSYTIQSAGSLDTYGILYSSTQSSLTQDDDGTGGRNFRITYNMTANTTYYVAAKLYSSSATGTFQVSFS